MTISDLVRELESIQKTVTEAHTYLDDISAITDEIEAGRAVSSADILFVERAIAGRECDPLDIAFTALRHRFGSAPPGDYYALEARAKMVLDRAATVLDSHRVAI